jgi:ABC-type multidrug transport system fused ATPase/permease subunit
LLDALQGAQELWVYGRSESQQERLASADGALARLARRRAVLAGIRDGAGAYLAVAGAAAVLAAALPAVQGGPSALLLVPLTLGAMASFEAMQPLADAMARFSPTRASAERLDALLRGEPDVKDPPSPRPVPIGGELQLERVCFAYGDRAVLTDVDLRLAQGRRVALVGPSGAGKSSVLALLVRFADPNAGRVTLHGIDVRAVAQAELRDRCSVVPQRVRLFHGSVRANLALARAGADEAALWRALERADLADVVRALPDGLDTPLGDQGSRLSGGERQRLALARAWLKDAPFWLLDEPTAHLDAAHERRMLRRLLAPDPRRAVLWITHRLVGMEELDEILVLDGGRVVERGAHARLARAGGVYARLLSAQREQLARAG